MPNTYLSEAEIRAALPDGIRAATTKYDSLMRQLCERVSRFIDRHCKELFYPLLEIRYFDGSGTSEQWINEIFSITTLEMSGDNGATYTALVATDYFLTRAGNYNTPQTYNKLVVNDPSGNYSFFYDGQRSIKVTGIWCRHDDRATAWEDTQDSVQNAPNLATGATALNVTDADGVGGDGASPRFSVGMLLRIDNEYIEVTNTNYTTNVVTILRGRNGTTDVLHVLGTDIYVWRPPLPVKQAGIIQAVRQMERGFQGFGDARTTPEIGQLFYMKAMDPEAQALLAPYRKTAVG